MILVKDQLPRGSPGGSAAPVSRLLCLTLLEGPGAGHPGQDPSLTPLVAPHCEDVTWDPLEVPLGRARSRPLLPEACSPLRGRKLHKSD